MTETVVEAEDLVPLGDVYVAADKERTRLERRAKRAAARSVQAQGGVTRLLATGGSTSWRDLLSYDKRGEARGTIGNAVQVLEHDEQMRGAVVRDTFASAYVWTRRPPFDISGPFPRELRDSDVVFTARWLEQAHGVFCGVQTVGAAITAVAERIEVDALRTYLEGLVWDKRPRIDDWIVRLLGVEDTPYARAVGRRFLIALVARGLMPGCKVDTMLVLEGEQGKRKSSALRALVGEPWYTDSVPIHVEDKDAVLALGGKWLVEFGELDRFRRTDRAALKDFISRQVDRIRPPFGRTTVATPRRTVFAGSTNEHAYLDDATGARRFWPVRVVGEVKPELLARWRDQLFAEAVVALRGHQQSRRGETPWERGQWWLTEQEEALRASETDERQVVDPWERTLAPWAEGREYLTAHEALSVLGVDPSKSTKGDAMRLGDVFRRLGFPTRRQARLGELREWRFHRLSPPLSPPQGQGGDKNPSKIGDVTTVTTVTTSPRVRARTRAGDTQTGDDGGDSGDKAENAQLFVTTSRSEVVTKPAEVVTGPEWGGDR